MYGLTPLGKGIYFEELLICFNFNMTSFINIQYFEVKLTHFLSKNVYFAENVRLDPLGCLCMDLPPRGKGIYFEEHLICFNSNMTFAMIIQDIRGQIGTFLSKYAYFAENVTFDPPGCLCMDLPLGVMVFFSKNY